MILLDMNSALNDLKPYIDEVGLVQNAPGQHSGNALLYTAEVALVLKRMGWLTATLRAQFLRGVVACQVPDEEGFPTPGYYRRHPNFFKMDQERQDDYIAIASLAVTLDAPFLAQEVLAYGRYHRKRIFEGWQKSPTVPYYFPNEMGWSSPFDSRAWIGAYPSCISVLKLAAGEPLDKWWELPWLEASIIYGPSKSDPTDRDSYILPWLLLSVHQDEDLKRQHLETVRKAYPGGIPLLFAMYFGHDGLPNPDHWMARYSAGAQL